MPDVQSNEVVLFISRSQCERNRKPRMPNFHVSRVCEVSDGSAAPFFG
jgi:hypothetical protein